MVTILLQQIIDILKEFFEGFVEWANTIGDKIAGIKDDTEDIATSNNAIKANSDDIKDNTAAVITPVNSIKTNSDSIKTDTTTIKNTVGTMSNQLTTISTNVGSTAAFTEDTATNTLNILDKVTTIASDTTQIRSVDTNIYSRLNNMEDLLNWSLYGIDYYMNAVGNNHVTFDTDREYTDLKALSVEIVAEQAGTGDPSPDNIRPISGFSSATIIHNNSSETISFGSTVYRGILDVTNGKLKITHKLYAFDGTEALNGMSYERCSFFGLTDAYYTSDTHYNSLYCSHYQSKGEGDSNPSDFFVYKSSMNVAVVFRDSVNCTDITTFKNYLATQYNNGTPVTLVYELATPIEVILTPIEIEQIFGSNTISTNTNGKVYVTYTESLKNYLED